MGTTLREAIIQLRQRLNPKYGEREADAIIRIIFHHLKGWERIDLIMNEQKPLSDFILSEIEKIAVRLEYDEPIQYITGEAPFYGLRLQVRPGVLIPRPETEGLVDLIVKQYGAESDLRVLDIGTGSGCIALALARHLPFSQVTAIDDIDEALEVARGNMQQLKAKIRLEKRDVFQYSPARDSFDIIVSNPPYIAVSERKDMDANVTDHEPGHALFVSDSEPLIYYSRIADLAIEALTPGGRLYLEINFRFGAETKALLERVGMGEIEILPDMYGRVRYCVARKPIEK